MKNNDRDESKSFFSSTTAIIVAIATLITAVGGLITVIGTLPRPNIFFPATETATTAPPPSASANASPSSSVTQPPPPSIAWTVDTTGVCRDYKGDYPKWTELPGTLEQCEDACQKDPNCQGFAMSKNRNYCQLIGSNGVIEASDPKAQITQGDRAQPEYTCYLKSNDRSILNWTMDSRGVCRDDAGGYPRWSEYAWSFSQCKDACQNNPNCQGFAMSKRRDYCQLLGSDGNNNGSGSSAKITHGDSSQPEYACFIKR